MDNRPIGVFDSGLGGLSVVRQLLCAMPGEDVVYFGDTGRVPYGNRSAQTICRYTAEDCRFLCRYDVKLIIAACGTASSVAAEVLDTLPLPAIGVVDATAKAAADASHTGRIGVIATSATVRTGAFDRAVRRHAPAAQVFSYACPLFVSLVENGWTDPHDEVALATAKRYLAPLIDAGVDTLILGCTHFPLLSPVLRRVLGEDVTLIDSGRETALAAKSLMNARSLLRGPSAAPGRCRFFVSDLPEGFSRVAEMFLGREVRDDVQTVDPALLSE